MADDQIMVIGGGPAGVAAAIALASHGARVMLVEQRNRLGGAIHRQPANPATAKNIGPARHKRRWAAMTAELEAAGDRIQRVFSTVFLGIDGQGLVLLDDRATGAVRSIRPRALVVATGAMELVHPFEGWQLPGVMTAGAAQLRFKETGQPPEGRILIAGSGALGLALAGQLIAAGCKPLAVLERGQPLRQISHGLKLLSNMPAILEGAAYAARMLGARVPYHFGTALVSAHRTEDGLVVTARRNGNEHCYTVDTLVVHDGIIPNPPQLNLNAPYPIQLAGDGVSILGADAARADGQRAGSAIAQALGLAPATSLSDRVLQRAGAFQAALAALYQHETPRPAPATVLCQCEGGRLADLAALPDAASAREAKLNGRFGMGACQGRYCSRAVADLVGNPDPGTFRESAPRWPLRPVSLAALAQHHTTSWQTSPPTPVSGGLKPNEL